MPVTAGSKRRKKAKELLNKLEIPLTMSQFLTKDDLLKEALNQRNEAAAMLREIVSTSSKLKGIYHA